MNIDMNNSMILEKYSDTEIPMSDWNITGVFSDILMCRYADIPDGGDGTHILRNGLLVPIDVRTGTWRVVEVLKKGPSTSDNVEIGDLLMIPNDRGISQIQQHDGQKERFIFINEDRIFCKVEPKSSLTKDKKEVINSKKKSTKTKK